MTLDALLRYIIAEPILVVLEIFVIYLGVYYFIRFCEGTRGAGILKGLAVILMLTAIAIRIGAEYFGFERIGEIARWITPAAITALIILLQPELRRGLSRLSQSQFFGEFLKEEHEVVGEIIKSAFRMAKNKVGALLAIEREDNLQQYVDRGTPLDAEVRSELLSTIFHPGTELHDGAVVLRRGRIAAAGSLFPLSESPKLGSWAGTRHRAAVGLTEETDAVVVVVSEERGEVSLCVRGEIKRALDREELERELRNYYALKEENELDMQPEPERQI